MCVCVCVLVCLCISFILHIFQPLPRCCLEFLVVLLICKRKRAAMLSLVMDTVPQSRTAGPGHSPLVFCTRRALTGERLVHHAPFWHTLFIPRTHANGCSADV